MGSGTRQPGFMSGMTPPGGPIGATATAAGAGIAAQVRKKASGAGRKSTLLGDLKTPTTKKPSLLNGGSY